MTVILDFTRVSVVQHMINRRHKERQDSIRRKNQSKVRFNNIAGELEITQVLTKVLLAPKIAQKV